MLSRSDILNANLLIVDDQGANIHLLEEMLRGAGYTRIASTQNPYEVCELYRKNRYDLILLDLQMPGMDGFQVLEGLKKIETDSYLPVLVITAQPDHKLRALQAGAKDFIRPLSTGCASANTPLLHPWLQATAPAGAKRGNTRHAHRVTGNKNR